LILVAGEVGEENFFVIEKVKLLVAGEVKLLVAEEDGS
jgi:hypothetical protein